MTFAPNVGMRSFFSSRATLVVVIGAVLVAFLVIVVRRGTNSREDEGAGHPGVQTSSVSAAEVGKVPISDIALDAAAPAVPADGRDGAHSITLGWGSGEGQVGRHRAEEGNSEAPMSLSVREDGERIVLDQVNSRLLRIDKDGKALAPVALPLRAAQDVAVAGDGTAAVLDRLGDKAIALFDRKGKPIGTLPLEGKGLDETGGITSVVVDGKDVYVEREHGTLIRVGDTRGMPDAERPELPGRPSADGKRLLSAGITDASTGRLYVSAIDRLSMNHLFTRELRLGAPVMNILLLDSDRQGTIYLATTVDFAGEGAEDPAPAVFLTCLAGADARPIRTLQLPANVSPDETFREFAVRPEGGVTYARRADSGMTLENYDCR